MRRLCKVITTDNERKIPVAATHSTAAWTAENQTERDSKIAILPIGYGDGFPRNLSCGKASVKIGTYIVPIIGRICMDQLAIDITDTEGVAVGDTATLIDNQENSLLSTPCVAERSDSISNEILSRMGARLPIVIKE